jgi:glycosyltransferase involved in cell wall biosynthesis
MIDNLVSVIIPNYNHSEFLHQRIMSVLNQTYPYFEVIILDDCSIDNSREIIESYKSNEKIAHIVYNSENSGSTFLQWEKGISLSKGEYIWIAESDDWCELNFLENLLTGFQMNKNCVLSFSDSITIFTDKRILYSTFKNGNFAKLWDGNEFVISNMLARNSLCNASMIVFKKSILKQISAEYTKYKLAGDYRLWLEICSKGLIYECGKVLNYRRVGGQNVTKKGNKSELDFLEIFTIYHYLMEIYGSINTETINKIYKLKLLRKLEKVRNETNYFEFKLKYKKHFGFLLIGRIKIRLSRIVKSVYYRLTMEGIG